MPNFIAIAWSDPLPISPWILCR